MRCITALLFGTALLGAEPKFPAAAFYWDATKIAIVVGHASDQVIKNAAKLPERKLWPPWGDMFALPEISNSSGIKTGDSFDINLTGNFWVRTTVTSFIYNKTEYQDWMFAIATIDPGHQEQYTAAIKAKLRVFLAEPANPKRVSETGEIRSPLVNVDLSASDRTALETDLNEIMMKQLNRAMLKEQNAAPDELLSALLDGKAKLTVEVDQVDLGPALGVRQHVLGTWAVGDQTVLSVQGWKQPDTDRIESLEAVDGVPEEKAAVIAAIGDWGEESYEDFTIENVFAGSRLIRHSGGYESSTIYVERMTANGRKFERDLYGG